jgi:hypothetical protein
MREREAMQRRLDDLTEELEVLRRRVRRMRALLFVVLGSLAFMLVALWAL